MRRDYDVIVLGGGAAGLLCAIEAGKRGRRVAVLERAERIGKKILISGGGRCNFTNLHCRPENFLSANPHFCKSALARYTPADFIALVEKHGIAYHENIKVSEVHRDSRFRVLSEGNELVAEALVVATGGLSIPKMGATAFGYDLARQFGLSIQACRPALVPLLWAAEERKHYGDLAGVSLDVIASTDGRRFREAMLFTHRGLSGPAILQISSYWQTGKAITIDLAPDADPLSPIRASPSHRDSLALKRALRSALPTRFADRWLALHSPERLPNAALDAFAAELHHWNITPVGDEGHDKAEVTAGGVDTSELSAKTMECRKVPGLYFIGEVVDVTGHLGGFNFQWAWASGYAAGQSV